MFEVHADTRRAYVNRRELMTRYSVGIQCRFVLSDDWDGLIKKVHFNVDGLTTQTMYPYTATDLTVVIPDEIFQPVSGGYDPVGKEVTVAIVGYKFYTNDEDYEVAIPTIYCSLGEILEGYDGDWSEAANITPAQYAQMETLVQTLDDKVDTDLEIMEEYVEATQVYADSAAQSAVEAQQTADSILDLTVSQETSAEAEQIEVERETLEDHFDLHFTFPVVEQPLKYSGSSSYATRAEFLADTSPKILNVEYFNRQPVLQDSFFMTFDITDINDKGIGQFTVYNIVDDNIYCAWAGHIVSGADGSTGAKGDKGDPGEKGDKGDKGDTGATGPQGEKGLKGDKGDAGAKGDKGDTGETGATGATGPQGPAGADGAKGDKGDKGDTGATGATGPQGPQGEKGEKGDKGEPGGVETYDFELDFATPESDIDDIFSDLAMDIYLGTTVNLYGTITDNSSTYYAKFSNNVAPVQSSTNQTMNLAGSVYAMSGTSLVTYTYVITITYNYSNSTFNFVSESIAKASGGGGANYDDAEEVIW